MDPIARMARSHTKWLLLSLLCGLAFAKPAHAGQLGPVWTCSTAQFGLIVRTNALQGNRCKVASFSPFARLFFFTMQDRNGIASNKCAVPVSMATNFVQINKNVQIVGVNNGAAILLNDQSNIATSGSTWFFCAPASTAGSILQKNVNVQVVGVNNGFLLMKSDQSNVAVDSGNAASIVQVNVNVQVVGVNNGTAILTNTQSNTAA